MKPPLPTTPALVNATADDYRKRYVHSEALLLRAIGVIPLGTQTFSKSKTQYPKGVSPFYIQRGLGSRVWDVDGNEYIDFINGLLAMSLGYNDPDITAAVTTQLAEGTLFSLPHPIEIEVAEAIAEMVPCAERVRFGKNGSDVTSAAIRLARAYTNQDHIAMCGYHGWQDWYIAATSKNRGIPKVVQELTHTFGYNDIASLETLFKQYPNQIAAVILEPMNREYPKNNFLQQVKDLTHRHGAVLIFDEMITGFRFHNGGAQALFGVTPDLATFGKGLANGYPLSALAGKADIMELLEEVYFSFTFGGETLSLAAAKATLAKLQTTPVIDQMNARGQQLVDGVNALLTRHNLTHLFSISGHPVWTFLNIHHDTETWLIKTYLLQELFARGILTLGTHNISAAHSKEDVQTLLNAYEVILPAIQQHLVAGTLREHVYAEPLKPLFQVR